MLFSAFRFLEFGLRRPAESTTESCQWFVIGIDGVPPAVTWIDTSELGKEAYPLIVLPSL